MRLHDLKANQQAFYYCTYEGSKPVLDEDGYETGETEDSYANPIKAWARISPNAGSSEESPFGTDISYDRSIATVQNLPIDEHSRLYIDVVPVINEDGTTDTKPDYKVVRYAPDLHEHLWAVSRLQT